MTNMMAELSVRQRREATILEHIDAENRHDPDATVATFSPTTARFDIPAFGAAGQVPDHAAVRQMWAGFVTSFPDLRIEPGVLRHGDDHVFVEVRVTGTQQAEFAGIPAAGRAMDTRMACQYEFAEDQLVCERVYMDFAEVTRQLAPTSYS